MAKAKHEYVVGYSGNHSCVYGRKGKQFGGVHNVDRLTRGQALRMLRKAMMSQDADATLYRVVPVKTMKVAKWKEVR